MIACVIILVSVTWLIIGWNIGYKAGERDKSSVLMALHNIRIDKMIEEVKKYERIP